VSDGLVWLGCGTRRTTMQREIICNLPDACHQWLPLIEQTKGYDLVYNWFDHLKVKGHYINGYVIMPNHLHALIAFRNTGHSINTIVGNSKRFLAYDIVQRLTEQKQESLLITLEQGVRPANKKRGKKNEVWIDSFDVKECRTEAFILQKLNYIHNNPCTKR
jgi:REP element-mobilizing transposase RayT